MKRNSLFAPLLFLLAAPATAEPCVSATFDSPFPDATGVEAFVADVPSARFPAFWQTGFVDGFRYRLFSNNEGDIQPSDPNQNWAITFACSGVRQTCDMTVDGDAPSDAREIAEALGQCMLGREISDNAPAPPTAEVAATETVEALPANVVPSETACGTAVVTEATDIATLQRLLILLGEDPGPVDGFLGPATFAAMEAFVEDANWDTSIMDVIALLDNLHCERSE